MTKKFNDWVRPGVEDVRANPFVASNELITLDLPTFDRPMKAISGWLFFGHSFSLKALLRNSALVTFMRIEFPGGFGIDRTRPVLLSGRLGLSISLQPHFNDLLNTLAGIHQSLFDTRDIFHRLLKVCEKRRVTGLGAHGFEIRF